jgi:tRNA modification GTPase
VSVSATEQTGIDNLRRSIADLLGEPKISSQGDVVAVGARHHAALETAKYELKTASNLLRIEEPAELVANHLREAMTNLEAIVGRIDNERILDKLFASFCIGK